MALALSCRTQLMVLALLAYGSSACAQGQKPSPRKTPAFPVGMTCSAIAGNEDVEAGQPGKIVKIGAQYYFCRKKAGSIASTARTAAVKVRSTQTISCGDGSGETCLREDSSTVQQIEAIVKNSSELGRYFEDAIPAKADVILQFVANNRAEAYPQISLHVQDADKGTWTYRESRTLTDLENDVTKLIEHFIAKSGKPPIFSREEMEGNRRCSSARESRASLQREIETRLSRYYFKVNNFVDAQMEECNLHWRDWVCLPRGGGDYAEQWRLAGQELRRKLDLESGEIKALQQKATGLADQCR